MKQLFSVILISCTLGFAFNSCAKKNLSGESMQVVRDCTGTYLRLNQKDYHVCNIDKIAGFSDGETINASFRKVDDCKQQPGMVCMMYHENEGWVEIVKVNN